MPLDTAKTIGPKTLSDASTVSTKSADFIESDIESQDLKSILNEFERLESEMVDISNFIYFLGSKVSTMKKVLEALIKNDQ